MQVGDDFMVFFPMSLAVMAVSILLIYKISNRFGFRMKAQALILCGILAFAVNFVTIALSPFLTWEYYLRIFAFVLISAAFVTAYNSYLLRKGSRQAALAGAENDSAEVLQATAEHEDSALAEPSPDFSKETLPAEEPAQTEEVSSPALEATDKPVEKGASEKTPQPAILQEAQEMPKPEKPAEKGVSEEIPQPAIPEKNAEARPEARVDRKETGTETAQKKNETKKPIAKKISRKKDMVPSEKAAQNLPAVLEKTVAELVQENHARDRKKACAAKVAQIRTLDGLLDYAYMQGESHDFENSVIAYREAFRRYRSDDYAPFITIDLANVYKKQGSYDDAIASYEDAFSLPALANNRSMQAEFQKSVLYLRITRSILARHKKDGMPFDAIPAPILQEIETIFQQRQKKYEL